MDDLTFSAQRAELANLEGRFQSLVQSPLRAGLVRFLRARANESFDVEALMQTFGRMRQDVENCLREMADSGVTRRVPGTLPRYTASWPTSDVVRHLLDLFLERRATVSEDGESYELLLSAAECSRTRADASDKPRLWARLPTVDPDYSDAELQRAASGIL